MDILVKQHQKGPLISLMLNVRKVNEKYLNVLTTLLTILPKKVAGKFKKNYVYKIPEVMP